MVQNGLNLNKDYPFILIVDGLSNDFSDIVFYELHPEKIKMQHAFYYLEFARYRVTKEVFQKISNSKEINYILQGSEKVLEGYFTYKAINRLNAFINDFDRIVL